MKLFFEEVPRCLIQNGLPLGVDKLQSLGLWSRDDFRRLDKRVPATAMFFILERLNNCCQTELRIKEVFCLHERIFSAETASRRFYLDLYIVLAPNFFVLLLWTICLSEENSGKLSCARPILVVTAPNFLFFVWQHITSHVRFHQLVEFISWPVDSSVAWWRHETQILCIIQLLTPQLWILLNVEHGCVIAAI